MVESIVEMGECVQTGNLRKDPVAENVDVSCCTQDGNLQRDLEVEMVEMNGLTWNDILPDLWVESVAVDECTRNHILRKAL